MIKNIIIGVAIGLLIGASLISLLHTMAEQVEINTKKTHQHLETLR